MSTTEQIKNAAAAHIETIHGYKQYKRENILAQRSGYSIIDLTKMNTFIDAVRAKSTELETLSDGQVEQFETVLSWYASITP